MRFLPRRNPNPFARWASLLGTTLAEGQTSGSAGERMTAFDYAYRIEAVPDWMIERVKA